MRWGAVDGELEEVREERVGERKKFGYRLHRVLGRVDRRTALHSTDTRQLRHAGRALSGRTDAKQETHVRPMIELSTEIRVELT